jgi:hypothetical protein
MRLVHYLGSHIGELLKSEPFCGWHSVRSVENDPTTEIWYEFEGRGVEVICDAFDRIKTVFVRRGGDGESFVDVTFQMARSQVLERLGTPAKSGNAVRIHGIGDGGAWDRFVLPKAVLHIQYSTVSDEVDLVTLMRPDAVP